MALVFFIKSRNTEIVSILFGKIIGHTSPADRSRQLKTVYESDCFSSFDEKILGRFGFERFL